jgi:RNA polymerase sigma factor (TIGR02999 family)
LPPFRRLVILDRMSDVSRILQAAAEGDPRAADQLLPLVYDELRRLAAQKLAQERPGQTLDATGLVHEAYLRLVGVALGDEQKAGSPKKPGSWDSRRHFFAAAAEAMRRILIENARRKRRLRHGGERQRVELEEDHLIEFQEPGDVLAVNEALSKLAAEDPDAAEIVKLRYFAGLSVEEAADLLGMSRAAAYRHWTYARAWLRCELRES